MKATTPFTLGAAVTLLLVSHHTLFASDFLDAVPEARTAFLYKFDEVAPSMDQVGKAPALTLSAPAAFTVKGTLKIAGPVSLEENSNYAQLPLEAVSGFPTESVAIDFRFRPDDSFLLAESPTVFLDQMYDENAGISLSYYPKDKKLRAIIGNGSKRLVAISSEVNLDTSTWAHLAFSFDSATGTLSIFHDGLEIGQAIEPGFGPVKYSERPLRIGNRLGSYYGNTPGEYDYFRMSEGPSDFQPR